MGIQRVSLLENIVLADGTRAASVNHEWLSDESEHVNPGQLPKFRWSDSRIGRWRDQLDAGRPVFRRASEFTSEECDFIGAGRIRSLLLVPLRVQGQWWGTFGFDDFSEDRVWSSAGLSALASAAGNLASSIERQLGVNERIEIERKLQEGQRLESLGVLAGGIAHDFNNLLTAILGNAGLARLDAASGSELESSLDLIEKTAVRAGDLCKQMLAYAGKGKFQMVRVEFNELIQETHELLQVSVSKKAKISLQLAPHLPHIAGDPAQLHQIILNLVINASEAIGDQEGTITISSSSRYLTETDLANLPGGVELKPGDYVSLKVADTGCGMDPDTRKRIFEPFFTTKSPDADSARLPPEASSAPTVVSFRWTAGRATEPNSNCCFPPQPTHRAGRRTGDRTASTPPRQTHPACRRRRSRPPHRRRHVAEARHGLHHRPRRT